MYQHRIYKKERRRKFKVIFRQTFCIYVCFCFHSIYHEHPFMPVFNYYIVCNCICVFHKLYNQSSILMSQPCIRYSTGDSISVEVPHQPLGESLRTLQGSFNLRLKLSQWHPLLPIKWLFILKNWCLYCYRWGNHCVSYVELPCLGWVYKK